MLSFGSSAQSLAQKYSDLQTKTTQTAVKRKRTIDPAKYDLGTDSAKKPNKQKKKKTFGTLIKEMVRSLILIIALFLGITAYIAKHKDKFKNIKLPNALKNVVIKEDINATQSDIAEEEVKETPNSVPNLDPRDAKIKELAFKFFEINK